MSIKCTREGCDGIIEASSKIYYDVDAGTATDDGVVTIDEMSLSHLNDIYDGIPLNVENELHVSCDSCGYEYAVDFSDSFKQGLALQPIGDAERKMGVRAGRLTREQMQSEIEQLGEGEIWEHPESGQQVERGNALSATEGWSLWDDGDRYNYDTIEDVLDELKEI